MDEEPYQPSYIRCTPERRAAVAHMRDLLAESWLAKEAKDLHTWANAISNLHSAIVTYSAAIGEPVKNPKNPDDLAQIRDTEQLDKWTKWAEGLIPLMEDDLRHGFEIELTRSERDIPPEWRANFWK